MDYDSHRFRTFFCVSCGHEITVPLSCKDRFCPVCSHGSRNRARYKMSEIIRISRRNSKSPLRFATLTIQNSPDLSGSVSHLLRSFKRLRSSAWWKFHVEGGLYVLEVTGGKGNWHAHLHLVIQGKFIPQNALSHHWNAVSGAPVVWIEFVKNKTDVVSYLTKYLSKSSVGEENSAELAQVLHGYRLFQSFGSWHSICVKIPKHHCKCPKCGGESWIHDRFLDNLRRLAPS